MSYSIVEFPCTKECEAVPSEWVTDNKDACWWPPYRQLSRLKKSIANREAPVHSSWTLSDARVLGTAGAISMCLNLACVYFASKTLVLGTASVTDEMCSYVGCYIILQ